MCMLSHWIPCAAPIILRECARLVMAGWIVSHLPLN